MGEMTIMRQEDEMKNDCVKWEKFLPKMVLRVMLVEPDDSTSQIITLLLRKCNYKVARVCDGLKAWELLNGKPDSVDLILTEVELPSISGFALLSLITEHQVCKDIPVIMMSPNDSVTTVYKCMLKGAADFLVKPVRKNELNNLWQHVWRKQAASSSDHHKKPYQQEAINFFSKSSCKRSSSVDHPSTMLDLSLGPNQTILKQSDSSAFSKYINTKQPTQQKDYETNSDNQDTTGSASAGQLTTESQSQLSSRNVAVRDIRYGAPVIGATYGSLLPPIICIQPPNHSASSGFHSNNNNNNSIVSVSESQRGSTQREAALNKFRMKRKERCYDKKVRYENRRKLAEQRPRVKGQFVRQVNTSTMEADIER